MTSLFDDDDEEEDAETLTEWIATFGEEVQEDGGDWDEKIAKRMVTAIEDRLPKLLTDVYAEIMRTKQRRDAALRRIPQEVRTAVADARRELGKED